MRSLWLVLVVAACGGDPKLPAVIMDAGDLAPAYGRAPYPTDALREGNHLGLIKGLEQMSRGQADLLAAHLAALDGFGLRPAIEFFLDGDIDPTPDQLAQGAALVDLETNARIPTDWQYDKARHVIVGSPQASLREGMRYAATVDTALGLARLDPTTLRGVARWQTTADAADQLGGTLAGIAVFTTEHAHDVLLAARDVMGGLPSPSIVFGNPAIIYDTATKLDRVLGMATRETTGPRAGFERWGTDNPTGIAHDHIAVLATGTITIARFRGDDTGTDLPDDETFQLDDTGKPRVLSMDTIPISIVLPKGTPPATGFPVVISGHGLGGSRHDMLNLAEPLTAQGYAVIAIDMWGHGSRFAGDVDAKNNLGTKAGFTGDRTTPDGFGDDPGTVAYLDFFEGFLNIAAIRDAIRQSALDFARVAILVQHAPDLSALAAPYGQTPTLDPHRVAYLGESFGTVVGTDLAAIEPSIDLFVLDVPGGGVLDRILPNSPNIGTLALPLVEQIYRTTGSLDRFHPMIAAMQSVFDGSDPLTFAPHVLRDRFPGIGPRHVVCIEAINDEIMPNASTTALAQAFGLAMLTPDLDPQGLPEAASPVAGNIDGQTGVLVQYEPATHGYNWSAEHGNMDFKPGSPFPGDEPFPRLPAVVTIAEPIYETHAQVAEILATHLAGAAPLVRSTKPPVRDFDGDGKPDDVDPDPLDPTK